MFVPGVSERPGAVQLVVPTAAAQALVLSWYITEETAVAAMTKDRESFAPDPANADVYRATNETYRTIRDATDEVLKRSYPIFH